MYLHIGRTRYTKLIDHTKLAQDHVEGACKVLGRGAHLRGRCSGSSWFLGSRVQIKCFGLGVLELRVVGCKYEVKYPLDAA